MHFVLGYRTGALQLYRLDFEPLLNRVGPMFLCFLSFLQKTVATLKGDMAALKRQHAVELDGLEAEYEEAKFNALAKVKEQYLGTLKTMKEDVASSKARSTERMEEEWRQRKVKLEYEWRKRFVCGRVVFFFSITCGSVSFFVLFCLLVLVILLDFMCKAEGTSFARQTRLPLPFLLLLLLHLGFVFCYLQNNGHERSLRSGAQSAGQFAGLDA